MSIDTDRQSPDADRDTSPPGQPGSGLAASRPKAPPLVAPDGTEIDLAAGGGVVAPHALNFAAILNTVTKAYSYRWDEALKDSPTNALAMMRDSFYLALLQERQAAVATLNYEVKTKGPDLRKAKLVKDRLTRVVEELPDWTGMMLNQLDAIWYGRAGSQIEWAKANDGLRKVVYHEPVNGDKIQYQWDRTPVVMVGLYTKLRVDGTDPEAIIPLDRGGYGLRLYKQVWRDRFVIHHHIASDADFFQGEMAGGIHGVGLRSKVYWSGWMRTEVLSWMLSFMEGVGASELIIFNYPAGNAEAKKAAEANAKKITNGVALIVARSPGEHYPAVEQVSINANGVAILKELIADYYEKHIERLFVGQSMSSGSDGEGSLGGSGRAAFAQNTKFQLIKMDAGRLGETLSRDLLGPAKRFNCPGCEDVRAWIEFACPDPEAKDKLETGLKLIQAGFALKVDEVMELAGFTVPGPNDKAVGGQQPGMGGPGGGLPGGPGAPVPGQPGQPGAGPQAGQDVPPPGQPAPPQGGEGGGGDADGVGELMEMFGGFGAVETYNGAPSQQWQSHTLQAGPRAGQTVYKNLTTGEIRDTPPTAAEGGQAQQGKAGQGRSGQPGGNPPQPANAQTGQQGQQEQQAQAKLASLPLDEPARASLWESIKAVAAAGPKAVRVAKAVVSTCYEEAKLWTTRLALAGVTYEEALPDAKELSNPLTGSTSATGGVDHVSLATGIPAAQFVLTKIAPAVGGMVIGKLKAAFGGKKKAGAEPSPEGYADAGMVVEVFRQALTAKFVAAFRQAMAQADGPGQQPRQPQQPQQAPESYSFTESEHPRDDHGRFVSAGDMAAAAGDPAKAAELRARVTDPAQRAKLDAVIGGNGNNGSGPTSAGTEGDTPEAEGDEEYDGTEVYETHDEWRDEEPEVGDLYYDRSHMYAVSRLETALDKQHEKTDAEIEKHREKLDAHTEKMREKDDKEREKTREKRDKKREKDREREEAAVEKAFDKSFDKAMEAFDAEADKDREENLRVWREEGIPEESDEEEDIRDRLKEFDEQTQADRDDLEAKLIDERDAKLQEITDKYEALETEHAEADEAEDAEIQAKRDEEDEATREQREADDEAENEARQKELEEAIAKFDAEALEKVRRKLYHQRLKDNPDAHSGYYTDEEHARYGSEPATPAAGDTASQ